MAVTVPDPRAQMADVRGRIVAPPIDGWHQFFVTVKDPETGHVVALGTSIDDATYLIEGVPYGDWVFEAMLTARDAHEEAIPLPVVRGSLVMPATSAPTIDFTAGARVTGSVVSPRGTQLVGDVRVADSAGVTHTVTTLSDGSFSVGGLAAGAVTVTVTPPGPYIPRVLTGTVSAGGTLAFGTVVTQLGGWISGAAVNKSSMSDAYGSATAATVTSEGYRITGLSPGAYRVRFSAPGVPTVWWGGTSLGTATPVTVTAGHGVEGVNATLRAGTSSVGVVAGTVTMIGVAIADAQVALAPTGGGSRVATITGPTGAWRFSGLPGGTYTVTATHCPQAQRPCVTRTTTLALAESGTLTGVAIELVGAPFTAAPAPTISGGPAAGLVPLGTVLTAKPGTWSPTPSTLSYQWLSDGKPITGATGATYTVTAATAATVVTVRVTAALSGYAVTPRVSPAVRTADAGQMIVVSPRVSGVATVGSTVKVIPGPWGTTTKSGVSQSFQWLRGSTPIAGATGSTYVLTAADRGQVVRVRVTGSATGFWARSVTATLRGVVR